MHLTSKHPENEAGLGGFLQEAERRLTICSSQFFCWGRCDGRHWLDWKLDVCRDSMNVTFSPDLARLLTEQVAQGVYPSVNVAVDETVRLLLRQRSRDKDRFEELRQEILLGVQDSERGNVIEVAQLRDRSLQ